ncbi:hypothetical protein ACKKBG_A24455 [Auxenochlorella protothecoides x Auxenochlorella symbiontica]
MRGIVSLSRALRVLSPGRGAFPVETVGRRWRGQAQASWHRPSSQGGMSSVADGSSMRGSCKIAVAQMTSVGDPDANFKTCQRLAQEAKDSGAAMLFLPENFGFLGRSPAESLAQAQPLEGPLMARYRQLAASTGLWLSLGGFQEEGPDDSHIHNTHVVLDDRGQTAAVYRKIHLFDVDVPSGPVLLESRFTAPGSQAVTCASPAGVLGLTTCYDLRFPELYQHLAFDKGADVLLVPSAFTVPTGKAHWEILLRARAIETQSYVIAAAQAGQHNEKRVSYGHSLVVDPWGTVCGRLQDGTATGIALADIDLSAADDIKARMPVGLHRRKGKERWAGS